MSDTSTSLWDRIAAAARGRGAAGTQETFTFLLIASLVGTLVGVGTVVLTFAIRWVEELVEAAGVATGLGRAAVVVAIPVGFWLAWWLTSRFAPVAQGDGVPQVIEALVVRNGYLPTRSLLVKVAATASTLGTGGSAGREGPIVQIGATIGSSVARRFHLGEDQIRSLVAAGAGAAIGAAFNAPIAGMLFAVEVILRSLATRHLSAVIVASVAAAVVSNSLGASEFDLRAFPYRLGDPRELVLYAVLGLLAVLVAFAFLRSVDRAETFFDRLRAPAWSRPLVAGLSVAAIGLAVQDVLGPGERLTGELLQLQGAFSQAWWYLFLLVALKIVATSLTLAGRTSGGAFMPSLFLGAALGAGFAQVVAPVWNVSTILPGAFAVVGMAATFAAVARAPLTSILIVFEITGLEYGLVLPLMLASSIATVIIERFHPESIYTMPLTRKGIKLVATGDIDVLDAVTVGEVMSRNATVVTPEMTLAEVQRLLDAYRHHGLAVVDEDGRLIGIITVTDILRAGGPSENITAAEAMTPRPVTVTPSTPVSEALERMAALGVGRLPVVDERDPTRLLGMFRREDAVRAYHYGLSAATQGQLARDRLRQRTTPGARFFEFRIPPGSFADGRAVREIHWPEGLTLVSVRRGRTVLVPTGATVLEAGDVVTAFGTEGARRRLVERLNATAEEPTAEIPVVVAPSGEADTDGADTDGGSSSRDDDAPGGPQGPPVG